MNQEQVDKLLPYLVASMKELSAGMEEKLAVLQESEYKDVQAAKDCLVVAATMAGVATAYGMMLGATKEDFISLGNQMIKIVLSDYDAIVAGNLDNTPH